MLAYKILFFFYLRNLLRFCILKIYNFYKNSILLIAHPDDESMFFTPLLSKTKPFIYCLAGDDQIRNEELKNLCKNKKLKFKIDKFIDGENWNKNLIMKNLINLINNKINSKISIYTFDQNGVSGHKNHISCHLAVKKLEKIIEKIPILKNNINFHYLKSVNFFEKYFIYFSPSNFTTPFFKPSIFQKIYAINHLSTSNIDKKCFSSYLSLNRTNKQA